MKKIAASTGYVMAILVFLGMAGCTNRNADLPGQLGDLTLNKVIRGGEAEKIVHDMHGKGLGAVRYLIGYYGILNSRNVLYASLYVTPEAAKADLLGMAEKMAEGTKVFSPLKILGQMGERVCFQTEGMGLVHYFYRDDRVLLWWQVEPGLAESSYRALRQFDFASLKEKATANPGSRPGQTQESRNVRPGATVQ